MQVGCLFSMCISCDAVSKEIRGLRYARTQSHIACRQFIVIGQNMQYNKRGYYATKQTLPKRKNPLFPVLLGGFCPFLLRKRCFRDLYSPLIPGTPEPFVVSSVVRKTSRGIVRDARLWEVVCIVAY